MALFLRPFPYSIYMFAITDDNGNVIAKPCSYWYISLPNWKYAVSTQNVNISIRLSIEILVRSSRLGSVVNLSFTTDKASSVDTL